MDTTRLFIVISFLFMTTSMVLTPAFYSINTPTIVGHFKSVIFHVVDFSPSGSNFKRKTRGLVVAKTIRFKRQAGRSVSLKK